MEPNQPGYPEQNSVPPLSIRKVASSNGIDWIKRAWQIFRQSPLTWLVTMSLLLVILAILVVIPFFQIFATICMPVLIGGLMLGCQSIRHGQSFQMSFLFKGFEVKTAELFTLGALYFTSQIAIFIIAILLSYLLGFSPDLSFDPQALTNGSMTQDEAVKAYQELLESLAFPFLIMLALLIPVFMAFWFAPALVILDHLKPLEALKLSFVACNRNIWPFMVYGVVGFFAMFLLIFLAQLISILIPILTVLVTLTVIAFNFGIMFVSMFTAYEDIFESESGRFREKSMNEPEGQITL